MLIDTIQQAFTVFSHYSLPYVNRIITRIRILPKKKIYSRLL